MTTFKKLVTCAAILAIGACVPSTTADAKTTPKPKHRSVAEGYPPPIGHRGDGTSKLAGFVAAQAGGVKILEGDVRFSEATATNPCGVAMVWHDATKGAYTIADETATFWNAHGVSTLAQILDATTSSDGQYVMELKTDVSDCQLAYYVGRITARHLEPRWVVESFITADLTMVRSDYPSLRTALISATAVSPTTAAAYGSVFIPAGDVVTAAYVADLHAAGVLVWPYTDTSPSLDNPAGWATLVAAGVNAIMTDHYSSYITTGSAA